MTKILLSINRVHQHHKNLTSPTNSAMQIQHISVDSWEETPLRSASCRLMEYYQHTEFLLASPFLVSSLFSHLFLSLSFSSLFPHHQFFEASSKHSLKLAHHLQGESTDYPYLEDPFHRSSIF